VAPVVFSNETFSHGAAVALADFNLMRMRLATGNPRLVVEVYHHPMPFTDFMNAMITAFTSILVGIMILVPFTFIPSIYVSFIVKETETQSKHLQQVSGMQFFPYWVSNFIFDFCSFLVTDVLAIIVFLIFDRKEYIGDATAFGATASLLLFYTLSSIMMAYALSFAFTSHSAAQNTVMMTNFVAGFILVLLVFILGLMDSTKDVADPLRFVLRLIPAFALGDGIIKLAFLSATASLTGNTDSPFSFEHIGYDLLYMGLLVPFFALLTLFLDHPSGSTALARVIRHWRRGGDDEKETPASEMTGMPRPGEAVEMEDPDVAREREEIESGKRANDLVVVKNLVKSFGSKVAVKGITFGIHPGEVFGFLGTNGAGKTTTMSILCGQLAPTSGTGWVAGKNVESEMAEVRRVIGYCPQFDAILELLTVEEHLFLFSGLRGLPAGPVQERVVNRLIKMCDLEMHRKKTAGSLSGGNKRKLSVAIALIGAPKVVFLDEPSAGMDPMARHGMWDVIEGMAKSCCVVLTTHHLEEVEALANRVAIMVGGTMKCVGSLQHLKTKFGSGFELTVRLDNEAAVTAADTYIRKQIPNAKMQEQRMTKLTYALPSDVKLSEVFAAIEDQKATLQIADYTVAQTSLEQVFLRIGGSDALESE
jgi:ABC-type multidrug transport system ATPase subunit